MRLRFWDSTSVTGLVNGINALTSDDRWLKRPKKLHYHFKLINWMLPKFCHFASQCILPNIWSGAFCAISSSVLIKIWSMWMDWLRTNVWRSCAAAAAVALRVHANRNARFTVASLPMVCTFPRLVFFAFRSLPAVWRVCAHYTSYERSSIFLFWVFFSLYFFLRCRCCAVSFQ